MHPVPIPTLFDCWTCDNSVRNILVVHVSALVSLAVHALIFQPSSDFNIAMADFIRSAKSGCDWGDHELLAYNIAISSLLPDEFFSTPDPSLNNIDPDILNSPPNHDNPAISDATARYLGYLYFTIMPAQGSFMDDFAAKTLKLLGFNERRTTMSMRYTIPFTICSDAGCIAQTDVCLIHNSQSFILLLLIRDEALIGRNDGKAQVIAGAIAAFQFNNRRRRDQGLDLLDAMTIPCITMAGTRPTFYLVPVTMELSNAVIGGQCPAAQTQVLRCVTVAADMWCTNAGMGDTEYRKLALKCLLAFKALAKSHWVRILEGV